MYRSSQACVETWPNDWTHDVTFFSVIDHRRTCVTIGVMDRCVLWSCSRHRVARDWTNFKMKSIGIISTPWKIIKPSTVLHKTCYTLCWATDRDYWRDSFVNPYIYIYIYMRQVDKCSDDIKNRRVDWNHVLVTTSFMTSPSSKVWFNMKVKVIRQICRF